MKGILFGSSQIQYIKKLFTNNNIEVIDFIDSEFTFPKQVFEYLKILKSVDFVYQVYTQNRINWKFFFARLFKKTTITHWIGSDVLYAQSTKNPICRKFNSTFTSINLACSPLIAEELSSLGVDAIDIPIVPSTLIGKIDELPGDHAVLAYLPKGKEKFYGGEYIEMLANEFPKILFHIVGNDNDFIQKNNVKFHGLLNEDEMDMLYSRISILFRFPEHDGLSMMLLEALCRGKQVIYSYNFPFVATPKSREYKDVIDTFSMLVRDKPELNIEGSVYVKRTYSEKNIFELYKSKVFSF